MVFHFFLKFKTQFGQSIAILLRNADKTVDSINANIDLVYLNEEYWHGSFNAPDSYTSGQILYHYILKENNQTIHTDFWLDRSIHFDFKIGSQINIFDDWQDIPIERSVFNSRAFAKVLIKKQIKVKKAICNNPTHIFEVHATQLPYGKAVCLLGSGKKLNNWDASSAILLSDNNGVWSVKLNLQKETFPMEYKFATYDLEKKQVEHFEEGVNRVLKTPIDNEHPTMLHQFADFKKHAWRGAGVNVQLSALKTNNSWGVGDFTSINLLSDWSVASGIKMIQLLPINDTTATFSRSDSYPYSAISAFALHPIFIDIQKIAKKNKVVFSKSFHEEIKKLNNLDTLDYDSVFKLKTEALKTVFNNQQSAFMKEEGFKDFFANNSLWLVPYAAFCFLRDKFNTADFSLWEDYSTYNEKSIQKLVSEKNTHFNEIAFYYFSQYHLHLQLTAAVSYAHKSGIIIKGDLPIGVGRCSVDTWMNPDLFHMDMQAGAPPDAFAKKGQNWSFPTYNWEAMKADNYKWWRQRLEHMSNYFDATRIDHVLGFFRIWSVPMHAIEGIFGVFVPSLPLTTQDFINAGLHFNESRLCNPFITDEILNNLFADQSDWIKNVFIDQGHFKNELNNQRKIEAYFKLHQTNENLKQRLFDLLAEVILLKDDKHPGQYHFRIDMHDTKSFQYLSKQEQEILNKLYVQYFYEKQNDLWYKVAQEKLDAIQQSSDMMICAEDLGMVPDMVEGVLKSREMLALQVQRMPKKSHEQFSHPAYAPYLSVVTPSTHDMSTIRQWWEEDASVSQSFYNNLLLQKGKAPFHCEPWICKEILLQHLKSPAMWAVFLLQDLMSVDESTRRENPADERINIPADPNHYWNYRMHITLESLLEQKSLVESIHQLISDTYRC